MKKVLIFVAILLILALVGYIVFVPKASSPAETTPTISPTEQPQVMQPSVDAMK